MGEVLLKIAQGKVKPSFNEQILVSEGIGVITMNHLDFCIPILENFLLKYPRKDIKLVKDNLENLKDIIGRYSETDRKF